MYISALANESVSVNIEEWNKTREYIREMKTGIDMSNEKDETRLYYNGWIGSVGEQEDGSWFGSVTNTKDLITYEAEELTELFNEFVRSVDDYEQRCAIMRVCPSKYSK